MSQRPQLRSDRPHRPRKRFGQHFLAAPWAAKVVAAIGVQPGDVFLEIGPGGGALTLPLAATGAPILAVEIDRDLVAELAPRVPPNVTLISGDFLSRDVTPYLSGLQPQRTADGFGPAAGGPSPVRRFRVVGNLPYNLSSPILARLIAMHRGGGPFSDATIMLQREVADRLAAKAGTKDYGVLTVLMQMYARMAKLLDLPPGAFKPPPKVHSSIVQLTFGPPAAKVTDEARFEHLTKALFSQRRKTLTNALKRYDPIGPAVLAIAGLDGQRRPETLQVTEIARLAELISTAKRPAVL
jgi:16S rRNA (adenine1518-N6/adenine1519-N6)-dimethyltransferase